MRPSIKENEIVILSNQLRKKTSPGSHTITIEDFIAQDSITKDPITKENESEDRSEDSKKPDDDDDRPEDSDDDDDRSEDYDHVKLIELVAKSLFTLNDDGDQSMDLVPELRYSSGITVKGNNKEAEFYVEFEDSKQAAAFCSKINSFTDDDGSKIFKEKAKFISSYETSASETHEATSLAKTIFSAFFSAFKSKIKSEFNITKFKGDEKYVINFQIENLEEEEKNNTFDFAEKIRNGKKAENLLQKAKHTNRAKRIIEKKDEPIKQAIALLTNLGGITPRLVGFAAEVLNNGITEPLRWLGIPGSIFASTLNQAMFDYAAFGMKRGNLFSKDTAKIYSTYYENCSKKIQEKEEINAAQGIFSAKGLNNLFNAVVTPFVFALPSAALKGTSYLANYAGDYLFKKSKEFSKNAGEEWSKPATSNVFGCGAYLLCSVVTGILGTACRTIGIGTEAVGEVLSKPSKAFHPEGSVKENRVALGGKVGKFMRFMDGLLERGRIGIPVMDELSQRERIGIPVMDELSQRERIGIPKKEVKKELAIEITEERLTSENIESKFKVIQKKSEFDSLIKKFALDIKNPKFNQSCGIRGCENEYMEIAQFKFNDHDYKVSLKADGLVAVTKVLDDQKFNINANFHPSLIDNLPEFYSELGKFLSQKRSNEEGPDENERETKKNAPVPSINTLRGFLTKFGGFEKQEAEEDEEKLVLSSPGSSLKDYLSLGGGYVSNTVRNVGEYSVKVDREENIYIGKIGEDLKKIEAQDATKNLYLFEVSSLLSTQRRKQVNSQSESSDQTSSDQQPGNSPSTRSDKQNGSSLPGLSDARITKKTSRR